MSKVIVTDLFMYPVKSTFRIRLEESEVGYQGLTYDRSFAVINSENKIITARENKRLMKIRTKVEKGKLIFMADQQEACEFSLLEKQEEQQKEVMIFSDQMNVKLVNHEVNAWISKVIGEPSQLVRIDEQKRRQMKPKYKGKENDFIGFKDASAIHLISASSVDELNRNLEESVTIHHFRPNIVIKGNEAYEEDKWKRVIIGACEFEVAVKTARCSMLSINPDTQEIDQNKEPLKTLAKTRKEENKVNFGIYLIPRKIGTIKNTDEVIIDGDIYT